MSSASRRKASSKAEGRAPVGVAIIAKDAASTLPACLDSIRPYVAQIVVCVDVRTTDKTAALARRHGADIVKPIRVSEEHECAIHEKAFAQHFARARQESFGRLDPALDFWMWIDADDVLEGGQFLAPFCAGLAPDCTGVWFPYHYGYVTGVGGARELTTLFHRERLLRTHLDGQPVQWLWEGRVHETVKPANVGVPKWMVNDQIVVVHQEGAHRADSSAPRNLRLLEIDWEEKPDVARTAFYLGNQYFALSNWQAAAYWYEVLCGGLGSNPYELWQGYIYMSLAYERMGDLSRANQAAHGALDVVPYHPEPYYRLAAISALAGEYDKATFFTTLGRSMTIPPFYVFKNPLDYTFNQRVVQGEVHLAQGRLLDAKREFASASSVVADPKLAGLLDDVEHRIADMRVAQAFVDIAGAVEPPKLAAVYTELPASVKAFGRTRDLVMPTLLQSHPSARRVVFWCGQGWEAWCPNSPTRTGIGGSETAVIEIARRFAADGWWVDVFNGADRYEGVYNGVGYWDAGRLMPGESCDLFVSWRQPEAHKMPVKAGRKVLWCHDLHYGPETARDFEPWNLVLGVSQWHADMLYRYYGVVADFVPNGINLDRFTPPVEKIPFRCVYASSADRGLPTLLGMWPAIRNIEPTAELHVAYGWETMDAMIAAGRTDLAAFKADVEAKIAGTEGVIWRGRLPQDELAQLYGESVCWLYPTDFLEVSCISAMEAMAAGAVPIATACGALPETVGNRNLLIPGPTSSRAYRDVFHKVALGVLTERNTRAAFAGAARDRAKALTWDVAYERWQRVVVGGQP